MSHHHHLGLLLASLSLATMFAWWSFSFWESGQIATPRPTDITSRMPMISRQDVDTELNVWMSEMEAGYKIRRQRVDEICRKFGEILKRDEKRFDQNLMIDEVHKLAYCRHGKVGTSTWLEYFLHLTDINDKTMTYLSGNDKLLHKIIPELFHRTKFRNGTGTGNGNETLLREMDEANLLKFSFVRHPFDRLVSAYVDKIRDQNDASYFSKIADIQIRFDADVSFRNFVDYVLDSPEVRRCSLEDCNDVDAHWRPFYARCAYCDVAYDVIGTMETFEEDVKYIFTKQNLTDLFGDRATTFHLHHSSTDDVKEFNEMQRRRTRKYFSELSREQIEKLFEFYKVDFEMFDYSVEQFLSENVPS